MRVTIRINCDGADLIASSKWLWHANFCQLQHQQQQQHHSNTTATPEQQQQSMAGNSSSCSCRCQIRVLLDAPFYGAVRQLAKEICILNQPRQQQQQQQQRALHAPVILLQQVRQALPHVEERRRFPGTARREAHARHGPEMRLHYQLVI